MTSSPQPFQKPKLLYVADPPISAYGGVSILIQTLINEFSKDYDIYLLSGDSKEFLKSHKIGNLLTGHILWAPKSKSPSLGYLRYVKEIAREAYALGIDFANFQTNFYNFGNRFPGLSLSRHLQNRGISSIWTNHAIVSPFDGYRSFTKSSLIKALMFPIAWLGKLDQLLHTDFEIQVSKFNLRIINRYWPFPKNKNIQIYHSILDSNNYNNYKRKKIILNVGYISYIKRQDLLVKSFLIIAGNHPDWELHLVGNDTSDGCLIEIKETLMKSSYAKNVRFLGHINDTRTTMQESEIYVHTSDYESLGLSLQEAMFYECAVIASDIPAHKELFGNTNSGILFRRGNVDDLAAQLENLINNEDLRHKLGRTAKLEVIERKMNRDVMLESYSSLYRKILNKKICRQVTRAR